MQLRMRDAWDEVTTRDQHKTVVLVTHGSAIALFLRSMFAHPPDDPIKNASITTVRRRDQIWVVADFAATPHLES